VAPSHPDSVDDWIHSAVGSYWPGAWVTRLEPMQGDASTRRFWRVWLEQGRGIAAPATAVLVDLGPQDVPRYARELGLFPEPLPEPLVLNAHRFLTRIGVAVPAIYVAAPHVRRLLVEDLGDASLYALVARTPARAGELYRLALDELLRLQGEGSRHPDPGCLAFSVAYDGRLFRWEMEQFLTYGIPAVAPDSRVDDLRGEIDQLADLLGALPRVFSHRDYHYRNLMVQETGGKLRLRVIDYQDALMAPNAQDLAVLLTTRETGEIITPALEAELLQYYAERARAAGILALNDAQFLRGYRWCVLQHALKVIGLFAYLEHHGKPGYGAYLPAALGQARRMLRADGEWPALSRALERP
jgi:aminoglycoside/choline kinase family phosphotransferase